MEKNEFVPKPFSIRERRMLCTILAGTAALTLAVGFLDSGSTAPRGFPFPQAVPTAPRAEAAASAEPDTGGIVINDPNNVAQAEVYTGIVNNVFNNGIDECQVMLGAIRQSHDAGAAVSALNVPC